LGRSWLCPLDEEGGNTVGVGAATTGASTPGAGIGATAFSGDEPLVFAGAMPALGLLFGPS
jgi:hypothetical protein